MEIQELIEKMKTATPAQNEQTIDIAQEMLDAVKRAYPAAFNKYYTKIIDVYKHDEHGLSEEEALEAVSHFKNADGTTGAHWSEETVRKVYNEDYELQKYPFWCVYYVLNMMYADYYDPAFANPRTYIKLTKSWFKDTDAPSDKTRRYIEAMKR